MAHHIAAFAFAVADCAPIDREARRHSSKVQHRPVGHRCTKNHPGIPYIAGHHSRGIEPLYNHTANPKPPDRLIRLGRSLIPPARARLQRASGLAKWAEIALREPPQQDGSLQALERNQAGEGAPGIPGNWPPSSSTRTNGVSALAASVLSRAARRTSSTQAAGPSEGGDLEFESGLLQRRVSHKPDFPRHRRAVQTVAASPA